MGDVVGRLFREFAVTLSITILISAVVSLTLTPMMCARLLRYVPVAEQGEFYRVTQRLFDRTIAAYGRTLRWVLNHQAATLAVAVATLAFTVLLYIVDSEGILSRYRIRASSWGSPRPRNRFRFRPWSNGNRRWPA